MNLKIFLLNLFIWFTATFVVLFYTGDFFFELVCIGIFVILVVDHWAIREKLLLYIPAAIVGYGLAVAIHYYLI